MHARPRGVTRGVTRSPRVIQNVWGFRRGSVRSLRGVSDDSRCDGGRVADAGRLTSGFRSFGAGRRRGLVSLRSDVSPMSRDGGWLAGGRRRSSPFVMKRSRETRPLFQRRQARARCVRGCAKGFCHLQGQPFGTRLGLLSARSCAEGLRIGWCA